MSTEMSKKAKVLIVALLVLGAYAFGRYAQPAKVVVTEKVVTVEKQVVVTQTKTEVQVVKVRDVQKDVHTQTVTEKKPDGTVVTTVTQDDKSKSQTDTKTNDDTQTNTVNKTLITQDKETTKVIENQRHSTWALSLQPGFDFAGMLGKGKAYTILPSNDLYLKYVVVGVSLEHRFVGPLSAGVWANTAMAGGVLLRLEW